LFFYLRYSVQLPAMACIPNAFSVLQILAEAITQHLQVAIQRMGRTNNMVKKNKQLHSSDSFFSVPMSAHALLLGSPNSSLQTPHQDTPLWITGFQHSEVA